MLTDDMAHLVGRLSPAGMFAQACQAVIRHIRLQDRGWQLLRVHLVGRLSLAMMAAQACQAVIRRIRLQDWCWQLLRAH